MDSKDTDSEEHVDQTEKQIKLNADILCTIIALQTEIPIKDPNRANSIR